MKKCKKRLRDLGLLGEEEGRVGVRLYRGSEVGCEPVIGEMCEPRITDVEGLGGFGYAPLFQRTNEIEIDTDC